MSRVWMAALALMAHALGNAAVLDDFHDARAWSATASEQVKASLRRDTSDGSLCLDYDFAGVSGYAVMRREMPINWPERFELGARFKGSGGINDVQLKFPDASGENVWWINRANVELPRALATLTFREHKLGFAWGPNPDHHLRQTASIELVVSAGHDGGRGTLCFGALSLTERAADPQPWPTIQSRRVDARTLDFDLGLPREFNGLVLSWPAASPDYEFLTSDDGRQWHTLRQISHGAQTQDRLFLPDTLTRWLRLRVASPVTVIPAIELRSAGQWPTANEMLSEAAKALPRGRMPRAFLGEQNYWTLVGVDGAGDRSGLISEDGAIEVGRGGYSVEPSVRVEGSQPITWADVKQSQTLRDGYLPLPSVHWTHPAFALDIEAAAAGAAADPQMLVRYVLRNTGAKPATFTLELSVRPWQVNPPQQFLSTQGGVMDLHDLAWKDGGVSVNAASPLRPTEPPARVTAAPLGAGFALDTAAPLSVLHDPQGQASALLQFRIRLAPGETHTIGWSAAIGGITKKLDAQQLAQAMEMTSAGWRERLNRTQIVLPPSAQPLVDTLRASLAQVLMSRKASALRPGTRSYARTWVRDGAMMSAALLRMGLADTARDFVDWFSPHVYPSGKVPCCIDQRGADPVVENDSHGEYLFAVAQVWRHTRDTAWLARYWAQVQRAIGWQEALRQSNLGNQTANLVGLLPPSISHEGYSDKPAYSYWDDLWALRGYKDAVLIAQALGHSEEVERWSAWRDAYARDLAASMVLTAKINGHDYISGAADRADFDATSTTIALDPVQAQDILPSALLVGTFDRYWYESQRRSEPGSTWKDYTPYELRNVGALVRLGHADRAHAMLDFFFHDQRPVGWRQWAEVVVHDPRQVQFLGDMPHAWVASDYVRSMVDLMAYEREAEHTLVIGAGWKPEWLTEGDLAVQGMSTAYGMLDYRLDRVADGWQLEIPRALEGLSGGLRLSWPGTGPLPRATTLQGQVLLWSGRELSLPAAPLTVQLHLE